MRKISQRKLVSMAFAAGLCVCSACGLGYGTYNAKIPHGVYHTVKSGESLRDISNRTGVPVGELALLNGLTDVAKVDSGQVLLVRYGQDTGKTGDTVSYRSGTSRSSTYRNYGNYSDEATSDGRPFGSGMGREPSEVLASSYRGRLSWPLAGGQIVSGFGRRPGTVHDGLDIRAPDGTPIFAAHAGRVVYADNGIPGYGNLVVLRSKDGLTTVYAHCRRLNVREGESVTSGQQIAEVGETGHATGPHLHFEVRLRSEDNKFIAVNPLPYFVKTSVSDVERADRDDSGWSRGNI